MTENCPNQERGKAMQVQEAQRVLIKMNLKRPTPRHIIIKMPNFKDKERILKAAGAKQEVANKETLIRLATDFSTETLQARRQCQEIFQLIKSKGLQPRLLYPVRMFVKWRAIQGIFQRKED